MAKKFLVKKDPEVTGREDNWIIMNYEEFERFLQTEEGQRRKNSFERLDPADEGDDILYMECDRKSALVIKTDRNHSDYLKRAEQESGYETLSLDFVIEINEEGETRSYMDQAVDETMDTELMAIEGLLKKELPGAWAQLDPEEQELMTALYISDEKMTINKYATEHNVTRWRIRERHRSAIRKLRLYYRRKKLL